MTQAYPLAWPDGWPRTPAHQRTRARFHARQRVYSSHGSGWLQARELTVGAARLRLIEELERLRAVNVVLSSNVELRLDGQIRSARGEPADPGVAVYFQRSGKPYVLACDRWDRVADNIAAVAKHIEAMRGMERWAVGELDRIFAGFASLPPPAEGNRAPWRSVLGVEPSASLAEAERRYHNMARTAHPDNGGSHEMMALLNAAIAEARQELAPRRGHQ